jgi:hypothetical protein
VSRGESSVVASSLLARMRRDTGRMQLRSSCFTSISARHSGDSETPGLTPNLRTETLGTGGSVSSKHAVDSAGIV